MNHYQNNWSELLLMINFAVTALSQKSTDFFSFQIEFEFKFCTLFDWQLYVKCLMLTTEWLNYEQIKQMIKYMRKIWNLVCANMIVAQIQQKRQADKHQQEKNFEVDNYVWVSIKNWKTNCSSKKLNYLQADKYKVIEKIENSYKFNLSDFIKIHLMFLSDKLHKIVTNFLSEQYDDLFSTVEISSEDEYKVEKILTVQLLQQKLQYQADWISYDNDLKWYDACNMRNSSYALHDFHKNYSNCSEFSKNLDYWLTC